MALPSILDATREYEAWLRRHTRVLRADLEYKHRAMAAEPFSFLRATYYRWAQVWPELCGDLTRAPRVLGAGDLHLENFGTWRDAEGRLVWGINDFDEASTVAYTNDLVRLAASAMLATSAGHLGISAGRACRSIARGYAAGISGAGRPFVLDEDDRWLRDQATGELRAPVPFWNKMRGLPRAGPLPEDVGQILRSAMPRDAEPAGFRRRRAGLGSLGHQRVVLLATMHGGMLAREAKALVPSAGAWAHPSREANRPTYPSILRRAVRDPDPTMAVRKEWLVRRLAPDCSHVELADLPKRRDEARLLEAMGFDTANVHHGTHAAVVQIRHDLATRPASWLLNAAQTMVDATIADWKTWRQSHRPG